MLGTNKIRKREESDGLLLQVHKVWPTIQGEGPFMGTPAVFLRLTGCNVACFFCDTSWNDSDDPYCAVEDIVASISEVAPTNCKLLVLTGGEPTRWPLRPFLTQMALVLPTWTVQIETNGTLWSDELRLPNVHLVCSPKTPKIHPEMYAHAQSFKYVLREGESALDDGLPMGSTQREGVIARIARPRPGAEVFVSPCDEYDESKNARNRRLVAEVAVKYGYRVSLQMHKFLDVE